MIMLGNREPRLNGGNGIGDVLTVKQRIGIQTLMKLPTLFKTTSTGALQEWTISTEGSTIVTEYGQVGGKIQTATDTITKGKNEGKANATTPKQQAEAEAQSQWEKKLKKGYVQDKIGASLGEVDESIEGGIFPMLAQKFSERGHKIEYPAYAQPKFDGHRCIAIIKPNGAASLWSRTRKPITGLPHIIHALEGIEFPDVEGDIVLDGELYNHAYKTRFEELTSFIRNPEPKDGHEVVQYHIYDYADKGELTFAERNDFLKSLELESPLIHVTTEKVADEDELMLTFDAFLYAGYEGAMVRNADGIYVNKRSNDLQKIKEFDDAEFVVTAVTEGRGKLAGKAIFICATEEGAEFNVKMKGKLDDLKQYLKNPDLARGRLLTVQYQGLTNKNNVPRFPVGVRFKDEL